MRQAANRLEDAGYVHYDDGPSVVNERVRDAVRELVGTNASGTPPSIDLDIVITPDSKTASIDVLEQRGLKDEPMFPEVTVTDPLDHVPSNIEDLQEPLFDTDPRF